MKKKHKIFILLSVILISAFIIISNWEYAKEIPFRFSKYHTYGTVNIIQNGENITLSDIPISVVQGRYEDIQDTVLNDNKFFFKQGYYGVNEYSFLLPLSIENSDIESIPIEITHFNTNWWHVNDLNIDITINTDSFVIAKMTGRFKTREVGSSPHVFEFSTDEIAINEGTVLQAKTESP